MRPSRCYLGVICLMGLLTPLEAAEPAAWTNEHIPELVELYRRLHQHPELSFHEAETAARLVEESSDEKP